MIESLIGNTPMIKIKYEYKGKVREVYAKLEYYNYTGSIKDRIANYIIKKAKENKELKDEQPIVEATSGNTGISFASLGALHNHPVHIFMPKTASIERRKLLELYGATIHIVEKGFVEAVQEADRFAKENDGFRPDQFNNKMNIEAHYYGTAQEILEKIDNINGFVSGIGTGGTLIGIGKRLKEYNKDIQVMALEPSSMPLLSQNKVLGPHRIEGIGDDFIPSLVDKSIIDQIIQIDDVDAINMTKKIAKSFGLGLGISSGANFLAAVKSGIDRVVTVFADDSKKYLSTDLLKDINTTNKLISDEVKLISIENI